MMTLKDNLYIRKKERVYKYKSTLSTKLISVQIFQELKKKKRITQCQITCDEKFRIFKYRY